MSTAPQASFWQRRIQAPLRALLLQGVTPQRLSLMLGVCAVCSLFPFLGATTLLNLLVGLALRLNQPLMHTLNQLLGPLQLVMIVVYVRLGEWVWGASEDARFSVTAMISDFGSLSFGDFFARFGVAGWHAFTAWFLTAPFLFLLVYLSSRPVLHLVARRLSRAAAA